jgi:polyisoprenoid-binding protein YceI
MASTVPRPRDLLFSYLRFALGAAFVLAAGIVGANAQALSLQVDPARTTVKFTLDASLHSVHGTFKPKPGTVQYDPGSAKISGTITVDAKSGESGNDSRDRKMHKDVLESSRFPDIVFHPAGVEGSVAAQGKSSVKVHGVFNVHGEDHEINVPAEVEITPEHWSATLHFTIPYAKWGMKNPSNLFLHVGDSVEIEIAAAGMVVKAAAGSQ